MGLAVNQARFLCLTARKADCELGISLDSMKKMSLTREMSQLAQDYNKRLRANQISYYANGQYNKVSYSYLMNPKTSLMGTSAMKDNTSMILTDYNGRVVLDSKYARSIQQVMGITTNASGQGGTFRPSQEQLAELIYTVSSAGSVESILEAMNNGSTSIDYATETSTAFSDEVVAGSATGIDTSVQKAIAYLKPIFLAAASNGWTTEYEQEISMNDSYVSDALISGVFQLATAVVDEYDSGAEYREGDTLSYCITTGDVEKRSDSAARAELTAWYEAEKAVIQDKEDWLDLEIQDLSTELEAINTEMESVKSLIQDATSVFDWGSS